MQELIATQEEALQEGKLLQLANLFPLADAVVLQSQGLSEDGAFAYCTILSRFKPMHSNCLM